MKRVESLSNPRIKALARMVQKGEYKHLWIVEGRTLFLDALSSGVVFEEVFVTPEMSKRLRQSLNALAHPVTIYEIPSNLMKAISSLETPPGVLGVARRSTTANPEQVVAFAAMLLSIRDPGNLGALARSAEASGCEFLACSPDCADPYQPKTLRASMGSLFRVPAFKVRDVSDYVRATRAGGTRVYALLPRDGRNLYDAAPEYPALILIGGETAGIPEDLPVDERIRIPMKGSVESLNTAMAGTLCFYHFMKTES